MTYRRRRRGVSFIETFVALVLLAVAVTVFMKYTAQLAHHRRAAAEYRAALREADNLMERLSRLPWEALTAAAVGEEAARSSARLDGATAAVEITEHTGPPRARQLTVRIARDSDELAHRAVRLDRWRFVADGIPQGQEARIEDGAEEN